MSYKRLSSQRSGQVQLSTSMDSSSSAILLNTFTRGSADHPFATAFKISVFLPIFFYHLFLPWSIPVWWATRGSIALRNHMIFPLTRETIFFSHLPPLVLWIVTACNIYSLTQYTLSPVLFDMLLLVSALNNLLWILRCAAIALKWGYATPVLLSQLSTNAECGRFRLENMFAWLELTPAHIIQELYLAGLQNGVDVENLYFRIDSVSKAACPTPDVQQQPQQQPQQQQLHHLQHHSQQQRQQGDFPSSKHSSSSSSASASSSSLALSSFSSSATLASPFLLDPPAVLVPEQSSSSHASPLSLDHNNKPFSTFFPPSASFTTTTTTTTTTTSSSSSPSYAVFSGNGDALRNVLFGEDAVCLRKEFEEMEAIYHANRTARSHKQLLSTETGCVPFILVLLAMTLKASAPLTAASSRNRIIIFIGTAVMACLPMIQRLMDGSLSVLLSKSEGTESLPMVLTFLPMMLGGFFYWSALFAITRLLYGGVIDYQRRLALCKICTELISPRVVEQDRVAKDEYPTVTVAHSPLQLQYPENIVSWLACRTVLDVFGERYKSRAQINCSACVVYLVIFGAATFFSNVLMSEKTYMGVLVCSNAVITSACPILMAGYGMLANDQCSESRLQLKRQQIMLERVAHSARSNLEQGWGLCVDLLTHASEVLSIEDEIRPLRIFGFKAGPGFFRLVVGGLTSIGSVLFRQFFM